jgi:hypothetical protein
VAASDWAGWHQAYHDPSSSLSARLVDVQRLIKEFLDAREGRESRIVSFCAGSGLDLLGVLAEHRESGRVRARLVELDPVLAARAREAAERAELSGVEVMVADAALTDNYAGSVPADLVLVCGVLGNVSDRDARKTVKALPSFCSEEGVVLWTRHRRQPDLTGAIRRWFSEAGFVERSFVSPGVDSFAVGVHQLEGRTAPLAPGQRLFEFNR